VAAAVTAVAGTIAATVAMRRHVTG
jgi:hypothetical protein